ETELIAAPSPSWQPPVPASSVDLAELLVPGSWEFCVDPFPHGRAERVRTADFYRELATAFDTILRGPQSPASPEARFHRNMPGYDASAVDLNERLGWPFDVFVSRPWHDLFTSLFAMSTNGCVGGALHHHEPGSRDG